MIKIFLKIALGWYENAGKEIVDVPIPCFGRLILSGLIDFVGEQNLVHEITIGAETPTNIMAQLATYTKSMLKPKQQPEQPPSLPSLG